ncbi:MAG: AGE family epimerase/isomerase, partial [Pseudomonadota bacterium]
MLDASLPFWAERGVHPVLGFRERLTADGDILDDSDTRVRLQARQTFCFAYGKHMGWSDPRADHLIQRGIDVLRDHCRRDDGLFGARMSYAGGLSVEDADLYDTAFALLAFSWAARVGNIEAASLGRALHDVIETVLRRPESEGGYLERLPAPQQRLQNPHMHLYEASLAYFEASGDTTALARARNIEQLLEQQFLTAKSRALREVFGPDWGPAEGDRFEAGHQYEWVWLMSERARLDSQPVSAATTGLYANALDLTGPEGAVALSHTLERAVLDATER